LIDEAAFARLPDSGLSSVVFPVQNRSAGNVMEVTVSFVLRGLRFCP